MATENQIERGKVLIDTINHCKKNLKAAKYMVSDSVKPRRAVLSFNGVEDGVSIPENIFKVLGTLLVAEYLTQLTYFEEELKNL